MDNDLYYVIEVDMNKSEDWDRLYQSSKQHTLFMREDYLSILGYSTKKYLVYKKNKVYAGLCIPINRNTGIATGFVPYAPYQGLIYARSEEIYTDYNGNLQATEMLFDYLYEKTDLKSIAFSNSIYVNDIRAVQWHHYHQPQLGMYNIFLRYTAVKYISGNRNIEETLSKGRKLDYRYSKDRYGLICRRSNDVSDFIELYAKTFYRQGITLSSTDMELVLKLINLLMTTGEGELWYAVNVDGKNVDSTFIVYDRDYAYYLFGANDPEYRKLGGGTLLLVEQMKKMGESGIKCFDFIGINSPQRGDFKLSFGGKIMPYYICSVTY